jgi:hypothetical protein
MLLYKINRYNILPWRFLHEHMCNTGRINTGYVTHKIGLLASRM